MLVDGVVSHLCGPGGASFRWPEPLQGTQVLSSLVMSLIHHEPVTAHAIAMQGMLLSTGPTLSLGNRLASAGLRPPAGKAGRG